MRNRLEICVDAVDSALAAQAGGAHRVELCGDLSVGGVTPPETLIAAARARLDIGLHVMIRPRGGDFGYSAEEFAVMKGSVLACKRLSVDGIVAGILVNDRSVDVERMRQLIAIARPMQVTFHRAFDEVASTILALDAIIELGVDRLLTSGQRSSALDGMACIRDLVDRSGGRIVIMPGAGIDARNAAEILARTGARELHVGSSVRSPRPAESRPAPASLPEVTDAAKVGRLLSVMNDAPH
jgi:copper homeostasis protein